MYTNISIIDYFLPLQIGMFSVVKNFFFHALNKKIGKKSVYGYIKKRKGRIYQ